jgi:hypothetical protein
MDLVMAENQSESPLSFVVSFAKIVNIHAITMEKFSPWKWKGFWMEVGAKYSFQVYSRIGQTLERSFAINILTLNSMVV